jgi:carbon-monoxide dehydrogenase medium subunit
MATDTRVLAAEFQYLEAHSTGEVLTWLAEYGTRAKILAGGTDLLVRMKTGQMKPEYVIYIKKVAGLDYIQADEAGLRIGAATSLMDVEGHAAVKTGYSALYEAIRSMAATAIRNMGTIAGNLVNASPAADTAPPLLVYDAVLQLELQDGVRWVPVDEFFLGPGKTCLAPEELLTEISIPPQDPGNGSSFLKLGRVAIDIAKINVAVSLQRSGRDCTSCRIAFGSVAPRPIRIQEAEAVLTGKRMSNELVEAAAQAGAAAIKPISDNRSTREYRLKVSRVILGEALRAAWQRAGGVL